MTFRVLANPAGQPMHFSMKNAQKDDFFSLKEISGKTACRWYWLLKKIVIKYQFTINSEEISRTITVSEKNSIDPKNRVTKCPLFEYFEEKDDVLYDFTLNLKSVCQTNKIAKSYFDETFQFECLFSEQDSKKLFYEISLSPNKKAIAQNSCKVDIKTIIDGTSQIINPEPNDNFQTLAYMNILYKELQGTLKNCEIQFILYSQ